MVQNSCGRRLKPWPLHPEEKYGNLLDTDEGVKKEKATVAAAMVEADF